MKYDKQWNKFYYNVNDFIADNAAGYPSEGGLTRLYEELPDYDVEYDSTTDTLKHIKRVSGLLNEAAIDLINRGNCHDNSKLTSVEKKLFDEYTPKLAGSTYGSEEYKAYLKELKVALDNHYSLNPHHPEHYVNGVEGMNLFDLVEMFFDWKAAGERHNNGNIYKSITINKERFRLSDQLEVILINTAKYLHYE